MTQNLPRADNFNDLLGVAGGDNVFHGNWLRLRPWTSTATIAPSAGASYNINAGVGTLHGGYFGAGRDPSFFGPYLASNGVGVRGAAFYGEDTSGAIQTGYFYCALFRQSAQFTSDSGTVNTGLNCTVTGTFQNFDYSAVAAANNTILFAAVLGRWRDSTIVDDGTTATAFTGANLDQASTMGSERLDGGSGYMCLFAQNAGVNRRHFFILRVNSGTVTKLAELSVGQNSTLYWADARDVEMRVQGGPSDPNVTITVTIRSVSKVVPANGSAASTVVQFSAVDTDASRITDPGRWGLGASTARNGSIALIHAWSLKNNDTLDTITEEWDRGADGNIICGYTTEADDSGVTGRNLHCRYYGDAFSSDNAIGANRHFRVVAGALEPAAGYSSAVYPSIDLLPAASNTSDRRTLDVRFQQPAAINDSVFATIESRSKLRPAAGAANPTRDCIRATLQLTRTGSPNFIQYTLFIAVIQSNGTLTSSTFRTWNGTQALFGTSTAWNVTHKLDLEVFDNTASSAFVRVVLNNTVVTGMTTGAGWSEPQAGSGYYLASGLTSAQQTGWNAALSCSSASNALSDNWTVGAPSGSVEARVAHQFIHVPTKQTVQARVAHQFIHVPTIQQQQARLAHQFIHVVHRSSTTINVSASGPSITWNAGAATISSVASFTLSGPSITWSAGAIEAESVFKPVGQEAPPAGEIVGTGSGKGTIVVTGAEEAQL